MANLYFDVHQCRVPKAPFGMATFEELFSSSNLEVVVPPTSLDLPALGEDVDQWYAGLSSDPGERDTAFFGKVHYAFFTD